MAKKIIKKTVKKLVKKAAKKVFKKVVKPVRQAMPTGRQAQGKKLKVKADKPIGSVTHYYSGLGVAIVKFKKPMKKGTTVAFRGATTDFTQVVDSMQYDHKDVALAPKGKEVGIKVKDKVREDDGVYLV